MRRLFLLLPASLLLMNSACGADDAATPDTSGDTGADAQAPDAAEDVGLETLDDTAAPPDVAPDDTTPADAVDDGITTGDIVAPQDAASAADTAADLREPTPPCAAIAVAEGLAVSPPLTLTLSGAGSTGDVARWRWSVLSAPDGQHAPIIGGHAPEATYEARLAGEYRLQLEVWDEKDRAACDPAVVTVVATPTAAIHLELVWDDNTADPTAEIGADLDLHVMHPDAVGIDVGGTSAPDGWFDPVLDVAWHNPSAVWPGPAEAPGEGPIVTLARRDDAGYGPEVITIERPRDGDVYSVGLHVWDDSDTGYLQPTEIRIWVDGVLRNKPKYNVPLRASILDRVMTVRWPFEGQGSLGFPFARDGDMRPASPTKD